MLSKLYSDKDVIREVEISNSGLTPEPYRTEFRRDYARLVHSASFRRLHGKMQLFPGNEGDYFRNRLTHSLEVAQVAKSIATKFNNEKDSPFYHKPIDCDLVEMAALAHDLGHPPFGHEGEDELDKCMKDSGGFEGNAQTLRILAKIEKKVLADQDSPPIRDGVDNRRGLNLTYRSLASILKYDKAIPKERKSRRNVSKGYYDCESELVSRIKKNVAQGYPYKKFKTIECHIMDIADDIAYSTYDLDDAIKSGLVHLFDFISLDDQTLSTIAEKASKTIKSDISPDDVQVTLLDIMNSQKIFGEMLKDGKKDEDKEKVRFWVGSTYKSAKSMESNAYDRNSLTSHLVGEFIREVKVKPCEENLSFSEIQLDRHVWLKIEVLKHLAFQFLIHTPRWKIVAHRSRDIIRYIFEELMKENGHELMPDDFRNLYLGHTDDYQRKRVVCDFIACMTDSYAVNYYCRLKSETPQSLFKPF